MPNDSSPPPVPTWGSLLLYQPDKKTLLRKGPLIALVLLPLAVLFVWGTATKPGDLSIKVWVVSALGMDFLFCCLLTMALWGAGVLAFASNRQSKTPYALMEWGLAAFWWWLIPFYLFGFWSWLRHGGTTSGLPSNSLK